MWNKFAELAQEASYKRLALALLLSILAHAYFFGGLDLSLPFLKKETHTIEARLQMPKVVPKIEPEPPPKVEEPKPAKPEPKKKPPPEPKQDKASEPPVAPPVENITPEPYPPGEPALLTEPEIAQPAPTPEPPQPKDEGLVINQNAYQYVETYFDVRTKIDGLAEGKANIIFDLVGNTHYQLKFLVEAEGVAAIFLPDLLQTSNGLLTKTGLQPLNYLYQFGNKTDKTRQAVFDWQANTLQLTTNKGTKTEALPEGTQDVLSFMYQFMYVAPLQEMLLNITNGKKLREYDYTFDGEELVLSPSNLGEIKAMHLTHAGVEVDEKIELWLAIDYQHIPVKIRKTEKDGKVYEFIATQIVTTRPITENSQQVK